MDHTQLLKNLQSNGEVIAKALHRHQTKSADPPTALNAEAIRRIEGHKQSVSFVFDDVYQRFASSPLLRLPGAPLPNILFHAKIFDRSGPLRCGVYRSNALCFLPNGQKVDLRNALADRKNQARLLAAATGAENYKAAEQRFAVALRRDPEDIIRTIESSCAVGERVFCEYALSSGIFNYRKNPLTAGRLGSGWTLFPNQLADDARPTFYAEEVELERYRATCLRSLLVLMLPLKMSISAINGHLSLVQQPVRVGGVPFGCISNLRWQENVDDALIDAKAFYRTYHLYHSFGIEAVQRVRVRSKAVYYSAVADVFDRHLRAALLQKKHAGTGVPLPTLTSRMSDELDEMTRVFPYCKIVIEPRNSAPESEPPVSEPITLLGNNALQVVARIVDNPYFDRQARNVSSTSRQSRSIFSKGQQA